eukprot:CAMPEP_0178411228 /NCGR_PEP_ID=MMETSP0689_2-20121128/21386_1 /TAXON_ID=160604 /ORGANISM="Amphidinium massartii, Strain CS-259" /LENGTH=716 /DNA_ID=CAMNT_0020032427 /DNA_START=53 /DNA_END=2203 /DNA_ORIENTATION=+
MKFAISLTLVALAAFAPANALKRAEASTASPVERVVNLLTELKERITTTETQEQQIYDKYACWCEKTTARKAKAIQDAEELLHVTGQAILKYKGKVATLMSEIQKLEEEIAANKKAQAEATALREKQNAAFMAESAETKQALAALEQAIAVLVKATGGGKPKEEFLQTGKAHFQKTLASLPAKAFERLSVEQSALLQTFAKSAYAPQSLTVQGILADMYTTFATDLEHSTKTEADQNSKYEAFIAAKEAELAAMEELKEQKEKEKAEAEARLAQETQLYDDTEAQMNADIKFFDATKAACREKHSEWDARQAMRAQELEGIKKALEVLTSDEARELFGHTIKAGINTGTFFLQLASSHQPAAEAYEALKAQASKAHSLRLARMAATISTTKVGHFDKVLAAIDEMIQVLKDEETSDIEKKDQCIEEYKKTNSTIADLTWKIEVNEANIDKFKATIKQLKADLQATIDHIRDTIREVREMERQRKDENQAYLEDKADDEKATALLEKAKAFFSEYYEEHGYLSLEQKKQGQVAAPAPAGFTISEDQAPEAVFSYAGHRKNEAGGVVKLFDIILSDLAEEMATSKQLEEESQLAFEKANATATELLMRLEATKVNLKESIEETQGLRDDEKALKKDNQDALKTEEDYRASITPDCDWIIGAFDERDAKRAAEMKGLTAAKAFLSQYYEGVSLKAGSGAFAQVSGNLRAVARRVQPHQA